MRLSTDNIKQPQSHRPWLLWRTLASLPSAREATQCRMFLEMMFLDDTLLSQAVEDPTRNSILNFILTIREGFVGDVKLGVSLGCTDYQ